MEIAKNGAVCQSQTCPLRKHCLRHQLKDYVPVEYPVISCVNLRNPRMQSDSCPKYCSDQPVRMPLGLSRMYHDMPRHLEQAVKNHLISLLTRKGYYQYHSAKRPVTPDVEQLIRQTFLDFGWQQEPVFDGYVEEYLW